VSSGDNSIKRADVTGSNLETLVTGLSHPIGISLNYNQNTLPVELTEFTAVYSSDNPGNECVLINWETASETDVLGYNIYRAEEDNINTAGNSVNSDMIPAAGNTSEPQQYSFEDIASDVCQPHYYWLEVINMDCSEIHGSILYTPGDTDGDNQEDVYLQSLLGDSYPNPVNRTAEISFQIRGSMSSQNATIWIYNIIGGLTRSVQGTDGKAILDVSDMASGIYFYVLQTDSSYDVKKFVVVK